MSMSSVVLFSLAAAVILVIGGGLVMYMANLVKNAYDLKVQIASDIETRLNKMAEELDKKSRWIKRDLIEEIEKIKIALETENSRKIKDLASPLNSSVEALEALLRQERIEWTKAVERDRALIAQLDSRLDILRRDFKPSSPLPPDLPAVAGDGEAATAETTARSVDSRTMSQFLPDLGPRR